MPNFKRILFPVDLSEQCREVAPFVKAMALRHNADVTMLNVLELPSFWYGTMGAETFATMVDIPQLIQQRQQQVEGFLVDELAGANVHRVVKQGDAALTIVDVAQDLQPDLVMMPTHGHGPFRRFLLGSVTAKILHDARCPVWTAAHAENQLTHPDEVRSVLVALELTQEGVPLLDYATQYAHAYDAKLRIVHAVPIPTFPPDSYTYTDMDAFLVNAARDEIARMQKIAGTNLEICLDRGEVGQVVAKVAEHHEADLIIMGHGVCQKRLGEWRTHAYSIIRQAPCPVLTV